MTATEHMLQAEINRCLDLIGDDTEALEAAIARAQQAIADDDCYAQIVALEALRMFNAAVTDGRVIHGD